MSQNNFLNLVKTDTQSLPLDHAVQFGIQKRNNEVKAFPYIYNFIRYPYQVGNESGGDYQVSAANAEGPDGLTIVPGGILDIPIVMDNDYNFHLLYARYGAFRINTFTVATTDAGDVFAQPSNGDRLYDFDTIVIDELTSTTGPIVGQVYYVVNSNATTFQISLTDGGAAVALTTNGSALFRRQAGTYGSREYLLYPYFNSNPPAGGQGFSPEAATNTRIPYWSELEVSFYLPSSRSRDLYGGFAREGVGGATVESPYLISALQDNKDGLGMIKMPYQLPRSATVSIRIKSHSNYPLRVYGMLFGYKITV